MNWQKRQLPKPNHKQIPIEAIKLKTGTINLQYISDLTMSEPYHKLTVNLYFYNNLSMKIFASANASTRNCFLPIRFRKNGRLMQNIPPGICQLDKKHLFLTGFIEVSHYLSLYICIQNLQL